MSVVRDVNPPHQAIVLKHALSHCSSLSTRLSHINQTLYILQTQFSSYDFVASRVLTSLDNFHNYSHVGILHFTLALFSNSYEPLLCLHMHPMYLCSLFLTMCMYVCVFQMIFAPSCFIFVPTEKLIFNNIT